MLPRFVIVKSFLYLKCNKISVTGVGKIKDLCFCWKRALIEVTNVHGIEQSYWKKQWGLPVFTVYAIISVFREHNLYEEAPLRVFFLY